jgi:hypothetical protein
MSAAAAAAAAKRSHASQEPTETGQARKKPPKLSMTSSKGSFSGPQKKRCFMFRELPGQRWVAEKYESPFVQVFVAVLIFANFFISAGEAQVLPVKGEAFFDFLSVTEWIFAVLFTIELCANMYGSWFRPFWSSAWNWFDFTVVLITILSMALEDLPGIGVLRLFRAFRVRLPFCAHLHPHPHRHQHSTGTGISTRNLV